MEMLNSTTTYSNIQIPIPAHPQKSSKTNHSQAGASEPRAGGTPHMRAALGSPCLSLKKFLPAKAGVISTRLLATQKGAIADHPPFLLMLSRNRKLSPFMVRMWA